MLAAAIAIPSSPPSSLLPTFGPGRAGQVVPRLDLSHLLGAADDPGGGISTFACVLGIVAGVGAGVIGGVLIGRRACRRR